MADFAEIYGWGPDAPTSGSTEAAGDDAFAR